MVRVFKSTATAVSASLGGRCVAARSPKSKQIDRAATQWPLREALMAVAVDLKTRIIVTYEMIT